MSFIFKAVEPDNEEQTLQIAELLKLVFPKSSTSQLEYLKWLYLENPAGPVVGYNAFLADQLVGHYVCIPKDVLWKGEKLKALLSLNTAVHPEQQGKGLFTKLAHLTYEHNGHFDFVYGVANQNSTHGFTHKLGFQLVTPLNANVGFLTIFKKSRIVTEVQFDRSQKFMAWRLRNPLNALSLKNVSGGYLATAKTDNPLIDCVSDVERDEGVTLGQVRVKLSALRPILFIGINLSRRILGFNLPLFLRPSPLNLIFKRLKNQNVVFSHDNLSLSFLDFDAY